jgi:hypothetical protein
VTWLQAVANAVGLRKCLNQPAIGFRLDSAIV